MSAGHIVAMSQSCQQLIACSSMLYVSDIAKCHTSMPSVDLHIPSQLCSEISGKHGLSCSVSLQGCWDCEELKVT